MNEEILSNQDMPIAVYIRKEITNKLETKWENYFISNAKNIGPYNLCEYRSPTKITYHSPEKQPLLRKLNTW